jgi:hypothetical protein
MRVEITYGTVVNFRFYTGPKPTPAEIEVAMNIVNATAVGQNITIGVEFTN